MRNKQSSKEISIKEIVQPLLRYSWLIMLIVLIFGLLGYFNSQNNKATPLYQSSAKIIVNATAESMSTLQVIMKDSIVLEKVISELQLTTTPEDLANRINVSTVGSSYVVIITATNENPNVAADIANTTARVFKETLPTILDFDGVNFLSDAKVNTNPLESESSLSTIIKIVLVGFVVGIGLAYLINVFDSRIRTIQEVEESIGLPVIGLISKINKKNTKNSLKKKNETKYIVSKQAETEEVKL